MMMNKSSSSSSSAVSSNNNSSLNHDEQTQDGPSDSSNGDEPSELEKHAEKILQNDSELLWSKVKTLRNGRVDFILDNAGTV